MINNVTLVGRMTHDAELRHTPSNQPAATFNLAVNRNFKNSDGEREADFINCVIWGTKAEKRRISVPGFQRCGKATRI